MSCTIKFKSKEFLKKDFIDILKDLQEDLKLEQSIEDTNKKINSYKIDIWKGNWTRQDVQNNPDKIFLFGDNFEDAKTNYVPSSTQAVIRGLPNAIGISTKNNRGTSNTSYLSDNQFEEVKKHIDKQIEKAIQSGKTIILPEGGIGTGKAMLADKAPRIMRYLEDKLNELKENKGSQESSNQKVGEGTSINIYSTEKNGFESLSNFAERPFTITEELTDRINKVFGGDAIFPGENFKSVEHAFQFLKIVHSVLDDSGGFDDNKYEKIIEDFNKLDPKKPSLLKTFGKKLNFSKKGIELWDKNSYELMKILIKESLNQNEKHKNLLLATKDSILTHTQDKSKWSTLFPKALMEIREEFIQEKLELEKKNKKDIHLNKPNVYNLKNLSRKLNINLLKEYFIDGVKLIFNRKEYRTKYENDVLNYLGKEFTLERLNIEYKENQVIINLKQENISFDSKRNLIKETVEESSKKLLERVFGKEMVDHLEIEGLVKIKENNFIFNNTLYKDIDLLIEDVSKLIIDSDFKKPSKKDLLTFDSPVNNRNSRQPLTDNFGEYINHKEALLNKVNRTIINLNRDIKDPKKTPKNKIPEVSKRITELTILKGQLLDEIKGLKTKQDVLMFDTLKSDVQSINDLLDNIDVNSIEDIKEKITFLHEFITGKEFESSKETTIKNLSELDSPELDIIRGELFKVISKYNSKLNDIRDKVISTDITYHNNVIKNSNLTKEDVENMFKAPSDLNALEKAFLGIGQSSNKDSVLPQILKSLLETQNTLHEAEVISYKNRLKSLSDKIQGGFDFIFEKYDSGAKTGNIIDFISPEFRKSLSHYFKLDKNIKGDEKSLYRAKMSWLKENVEVIDFRKLKVVKNIYGQAYSNHFKFSDTEMDAYEDKLKKLLGPIYESEIEKVLQWLENFENHKQNLSSLPNVDIQREETRNNPFEFIDNYYSRNYLQPLYYNNNSGNSSYVYPDLYNIVFVPLDEKVVTYDVNANPVYAKTNYYNETFKKEVMSNPDKLEYWKLLKEIYGEYINPSYDIKGLSYAKFEKDFLENIANQKNIFTKGSSLLSNAIKTYRSYFYENGVNNPTDRGVVANYSDKTKRDIRNLEQALKSKSIQELQKMASDLGLSFNKMDKNILAKEIASQTVLNTFSEDINKITGALLDTVALQKAREAVLPMANIILDSHKAIKDVNGNDRKRSIEKLEKWIDRVIKNNSEHERGKDGLMGKNLSDGTWFSWLLDRLAKIPFIKNKIHQKSGYLLSDKEKELLKNYLSAKEKGHDKKSSYTITLGDNVFHASYSEQTDTTLYFGENPDGTSYMISEKQFEDIFQKNIENKISALGLDLNAAGVVQGILKTIILKALGLNPIAGIFNRIEGKNAGLIMDQTGHYWTTGNIVKSNNFLALSNIIRISPDRFTPEQWDKVKEIKKFEAFLNSVNLVQDRKNVLEKNVDNKYEKVAGSIFAFAVDNPEFKNQGAIILSILMDTKIKDINGNEVPLFDGKEFPAYDLINEKLVLKPEFRTVENIANWENFEVDLNNLENNQFLLQRNKMKNAISRSQGNYDNLDVIDITRTTWGKVFSLFKKWMPEHIMQRFSNGEEFDIITGKNKQKGRYRYLMDNNPALITTGLIGVTTAAGLGSMAVVGSLGIGGLVAYKVIKNIYGGKQGIRQQTDSIKETTSFLKAILIQTLNYPLELVNIKKGIKTDFDGYSKSNLTEEEIGALRAVAKEIGVKLTMLSLMLIAKSMTWDEDDDEESSKRKFHNFVDNQLNKVINTVDMYQNPVALYDDASRLSAVQWCKDVIHLMDAIQDGDGDKSSKYFWKVTPVPRFLTQGNLPIFEDREYQANQWIDVYIKDSKTDGEYSAKKEYQKIRKKKTSELKEQGYSEKEIKKILPKKDRGESFKDVLEEIKSFK